MSSAFIEHTPGIGALNIAVGPAPLTLTLQPTSVRVSNTAFFALPAPVSPEHVAALPSSGPTRLRIPAMHNPNQEASIDPRHDRIEQEIARIKSAASPNLDCHFCRTPLLVSATAFARVLELPAENWQELAATLSCHDEFKDLAAHVVGPRQADLLVGDAHYLVHPESLQPESIKHGPPHSSNYRSSTQAICNRCRSPLGFVNFHGKNIASVHLYKHAITVVSSNQPLFDAQPKSLSLAAELALQARHQESHRLVIVSRFVPPEISNVAIRLNEGFAHALIRITTPRVNIASNTQAWFKLLELAGRAPDVKFAQAMKVLYIDAMDEASRTSSQTLALAKEWSNDASVGYIEFDYEVGFIVIN